MGRQRTIRIRFLFVAAMFLLCCPVFAGAQTITEYPIPTASSEPQGITSGPDGALWFTEFMGDKIGRITASGTISEFPVPTPQANPYFITSGPDGALWFTESLADKIGRITTAGTITEYPVGSGPISIAAGPDGALWFDAYQANAIGRITTAGVITAFPIPTVNSEPFGITSGPDGALWFTEYGGNKVGRITTAGVFTEYALPTAHSAPYGVTSGPDGALWFAEGGCSPFVCSPGVPSKIGRITTSGTITEYQTPSPNGVPQVITPGPDGALWFTEQNGNIGRITTAGAITEYPLPGRSNDPVGIISGPGGALWFTTGNVIGNITVPGPTSTLTVSESGTGSGQVTSSPSAINCSTTSSQCSAPFGAGSMVTLTASANSGSVFSGWSGGGCSGTAPCTLTLNADTTMTAEFDLLPSYTLSIAPAGTGSGTVTSNPSGIACGATCNASYQVNTQVTLTAAANSGSTFAGWSGGGCSGIDGCTVTMTSNTAVTANFAQNSATSIALQAAVLPLSRSVQVGNTATAFATILNAGPGTASTCTIAPATSVPASFLFQTTDPTTNALTGTANTPADIAQGAGQSFLIAFTPSAAFAPINILLSFGCANASPAPQTIGIDTLNLSASASAVPDIVALAASGDPGYVDIPGATGTGDFAVATVNLGSAAQITASPNTGTANLPVILTICQTNPSSGTCLAAPAANVTTTIAANATPTFGIFVTGSAAVPDLPGLNRVFVTFDDANGVLRGETSVAVRTQ